MIVVLILGLVLTLTYYAVSAFQSAGWGYASAVKLYQKEQALIFLDSALRKMADILDSRDDKDYDGLDEFWAKPIELNTPLGVLKVEVVDLDRYIDVNLIGKNKKLTEVFENLLRLLEIDPYLLDLLLVWKGDQPRSFWSAKYPPKGRPLDSVYEIALFWEKRGDLYGKRIGQIEYPGLLEFLTVHSSGRININTAPYWVIRSLDPYFDDTLAREIIEYRKSHPFKSVNDLLNVEGIDMDLLYRVQDILTTKSRYFKITATLEGSATSLTVEAVYDRWGKRFVEKGVY